MALFYSIYLFFEILNHNDHVTRRMKRVTIPLKKQSCVKKRIFNSSSSGSENEEEAYPVNKRLKLDTSPADEEDYSTMDLIEKEKPEEIVFRESLFESGKDRDGFIVGSGKSEKSKGLKIMEKMGFKMGDTLGSHDNETALKEPLKLHHLTKIGKSRQGLRETPKLIPESMNIQNASEYRLRLSSEKAAAVKEKEVAQLQQKVFDLEKFDDYQLAEMNPTMISPSFRQLFMKIRKQHMLSDADNPQGGLERRDSEDIEVEQFNGLTLDEQLLQLNKYCSDKFNYCYWCGVKFDDSADIEKNCPGLTKGVHEV